MTLRSLRLLLPASVAAALLAAMATTGVIFLALFARSMDDQLGQRLLAAQAGTVARIEATFDDLTQDVAARAGSGTPAEGIQRLSDLLVQAGSDGRTALRASLTTDAADGSRYRLTYDSLLGYFAAAQAEHGYYDIFLINRDGDVLLTLAKERDLLGNVRLGELATTGLSRAFAEAMKAPDATAVFADYEPYAPSNGALAAFIAAPVRDETGQTLGVYAVQVPNLTPPALDPALGAVSTTVIGPDNLLRLAQDGADGSPLSLGADVARSAALARALDGQTGLVTGQSNASGEPVLVAHAPIHLATTDWAISTTLPRPSLWAHLAPHRTTLLATLALLALAPLLAGLGVWLWLARPLAQLAKAVESRRTDPDATLPQTHRRDEIGRIARAALQAASRPAEPAPPAQTFDQTLAEPAAPPPLAERQTEDRLRSVAILDAIAANQVMLELDPDARVISANAHACRLYGYSAEEFVGLDLRRLMQDDGRSLPDLMARLAAKGTLTERQHRRTKSGVPVWVDCTFTAIRDESGALLRIVVICVDVTASVQRIAAIEEEHRAHRDAQAKVVGDLGTALAALAEGNLTVALADPFDAEYETLRANFNAAVDRLEQALGGVVAGAVNIRNGAAEITEAADDLSRRTESQAATLEETAAALDMLTASVKASALGADEADRSVTEARAHAESSGAVVVEAVAAMGEIEQSSRQIRQIIGVIDDIAFQTNLLALNAGVEAARAGEAGRGFAVVASEVRALAQRSSEAAREIKELISASSRHVEKGVGLVGETGAALKAIVQGVSDIATRVSAIAQSAREQATGLSEINAGMANMDQVTQQNAAMVEESTAASHSLRSEAEHLADVIGHFRLRRQPAKAAPLAARPARPTPPAAPMPTLPPAPRAPARLQTAAGWEEF